MVSSSTFRSNQQLPKRLTLRLQRVEPRGQLQSSSLRFAARQTAAMPPRKRKKKAAAAKKEEGEEEPFEAEAEEPAAKKQETEAGEEAGEEAAPALLVPAAVPPPEPAPAAPPLDAEVASLLASAREAVAPQPSVVSAPPQPSVVQAPPQPSYHAQLAQARAAPQASSYYPQQVQGSPEPLPGDDTNPTKLFVGGLSMVTCKEDLQEYFGRFSAVHDAVIQKHRMTKQSRAVWKSNFGRPTPSTR